MTSYDEVIDATLGPIRGVFDNIKNPLVSIEQAIQALPLDLAAELFQCQQFLISAVGKKALSKATKLTRDSAGAIWIYTCESPLYKELNRLLRARNRDELLKGWFPFLRLLLEAFRCITLKERSCRVFVLSIQSDASLLSSPGVW